MYMDPGPEWTLWDLGLPLTCEDEQLVCSQPPQGCDYEESPRALMRIKPEPGVT